MMMGMIVMICFRTGGMFNLSTAGLAMMAATVLP